MTDQSKADAGRALEGGPNCGADTGVVPPAPGSALLDRLEQDLGTIKDAAMESGAGDPPAGYEELKADSDALRIADECWHNGMDAMETAIRNWIYDQRNNETQEPPPEAAARITEILDQAYANWKARHVGKPNVIVSQPRKSASNSGDGSQQRGG